MSTDCIFCKIVAGQIPSTKVYEDDEILAFKDIHPARPVHVLVIPKKHIESLAHVTEEDVPVLGRMLAVANRIATESDAFGFRVLARMARCVERAAKANDMNALRNLLPELAVAVERNRIGLTPRR